jgi:hypothetical protein
MYIRRPARPEPLPLRERSACAPALPPGSVWLNVRHKRSHCGRPLARRISQRLRGPSSAPQK